MVEVQPDNRSRLPISDIRLRSRIAFARIAAIALVGSAAFWGPHSSANPIGDSSHASSSAVSAHYEPDYNPSSFDAHDTTRRVMACFDEQTAGVPASRDAFTAHVDMALAEVKHNDPSQATDTEGGLSDAQADILYDTFPLAHIPCLTAEVTGDGYTAIKNADGLVTIAEDVALQPNHHETSDLAGGLLTHTGADFAHHHDIDGQGQRIVIADTGTNFSTGIDSYRNALDIYSGCVGVNYTQGNLFSVCPEGQDRVLGDYAAAVYSDSLVNGDHGHTEGQLANDIAHAAHIVHVALNTVVRHDDGEQLVFFASEMVRAIDIALTLQADSITISMATTDARGKDCNTYFEPFNIGVQSAHAVDVPVFISAGNSQEVDWPACIDEPGVYPITTVNYASRIPYFAGYDDPRMLAALGEGVPVEGLKGSLKTTSGTSNGPPVAAGLLALMQSADASLSSDEALALFRQYANDATAADGTRVPDMNIARILQSPKIGSRLGIYFRALMPYLLDTSN